MEEWDEKVSQASEHQKAYAQSLRDARSQYYSIIINNSTGNSKQLFSTINHLLKPQSPLHSESTEKQCSNFAAFFKNKVDTIRSILSSPSAPPIKREEEADERQHFSAAEGRGMDSHTEREIMLKCRHGGKQYTKIIELGLGSGNNWVCTQHHHMPDHKLQEYMWNCKDCVANLNQKN
ncbi:hypothetical protein F7725_001704 [Dissostichus mawsoni]|uniref:Uncharacterized protein n=1 Tax=Dissostichus mawsoni TaxID=36200 RepID=A0A7J5Y0C8_DISMA|nr:hypothetical protein F7725_001704 [Dissostichus mawsoni]